MKRFVYTIVSVVVVSLAMMNAAWAAETKEEKTLGKESAEITKTAGKTQGATVVTARLEKELEASYRFTHTRTREEFNLKGKSRKREWQPHPLKEWIGVTM